MLLGFNTFGIYQHDADVQVYVEVARRADELGFDSRWTGHHIVFESRVSPTYRYSRHGAAPQDPAGHRFDPWALFAHLRLSRAG